MRTKTISKICRGGGLLKSTIVCIAHILKLNIFKIRRIMHRCIASFFSVYFNSD